MVGRAFFLVLSTVLVVALGFAIWGLVGTFERFGENEKAQREEVAQSEKTAAEATPAETTPTEEARTGAPAAPTPRIVQDVAAPGSGAARPGTEPGPAPPADPDLAAPSEDAAPDTPDEGETETAAPLPPGEPPLPRRRPTRDAASAFELRAATAGSRPISITTPGRAVGTMPAGRSPTTPTAASISPSPTWRSWGAACRCSPRPPAR